MNRVLQLKRNQNIYASREAAINVVSNLQLVNGELIIASYTDTNAVNGKADILVIKSQNKLFYVDNQELINKLGVAYGATLEFDGRYISGDSTFKEAIETLDTIIVSNEGKLEYLSGKSITSKEDTNSVTLTIIDNAEDGTKKLKADVNISTSGSSITNDENIIKINDDGLYTSVGYNSSNHSIVVNGEEKQLNNASLIKGVEYVASAETIVISFSDMSGTTKTVEASLKELIEEYDFKESDETHNVSITSVRTIDGKTEVRADLSNFDCGFY